MNREFWDNRYRAEEYAYGTKPNEYFKIHLEGILPGRLLLPAEGEGRNAVYAAKLGWEVYAFDQSLEAKAKALRLADHNQVTINYEVSSIENFQPPTEGFDLIALIYVHMPPETRTKFHQDLVKMLKPAGDIVLEAFNKKQVSNQSGGPKMDALLYEEPMLRNDFQGLGRISISNEEVFLHEGPYHKGKADVIRMLGKI